MAKNLTKVTLKSVSFSESGERKTDLTVQSPIILVDGSSYLFRAYHALPELKTSGGLNTGAVRGVISMVRKLQLDYSNSPIIMIFDAKGPTFRHQIFPDYKANRPPMPEELVEQIAPIHRIIQAMGLPLLVVPGVEADDVIGTLAKEATEAKLPVVISTGDKDMAQLVNEHVTLVNTMTDIALDRAGVIEKFGVPPEGIVDYLALIGDTSDNIPGVPKVGPKTAAKWLNEYQDMDQLLEHAESIGGKVGENLRNHAGQIPLSRELATIKQDVVLDIRLMDVGLAIGDDEELRNLYEQFEFKTWLADLSSEKATVEAVVPEKVNYIRIDTAATLQKWADEARAAGQFAFDTETTSLDYMEAHLVGVSLCTARGNAGYIPIAHTALAAGRQLALDDVLAVLSPLLEDPEIIKIGQNIKYDMSVLARYGVNVRGRLIDTMLESYVLNSVATRHNMDALAAKYLGIKTISFEEVAGKGSKQITFDHVPIEQAVNYAAEDADITIQLHEYFAPELGKDPELIEVLDKVEIPLVPVLSRIERQGALVDGKLLKAQGKELMARMLELTDKAWAIAGEEFNLDSPKQLQQIFYEKLGLPILKKTPKGQPSTAEPVLVDLAQDFELPEIILQYRSLAKLKSTYTDKLPLQINETTGRIHTSYHQAVTATGRLSSSDPNLQNIPIRNAEGRRIRQAFIAAPGKKIVAADYSQIELRIMAHLANDESLRSAFWDKADIHRATASEVFNVDAEAVTEEQRRRAKAINFGLIYGMSAFGLGKQLGISRGLAQEYIDRYFQRYPGVLEYMEATRASAAREGYVKTLFGRRLYLPEITSRNAARRQAAERTAINAPMQGTAADIIKLAMIEVDSWLASTELNALMIMQVHDELVFEVAEEDINAAVISIRSHMEGAAKLDVPLIVDIGIGNNWDEAH